MSPRVLGSLHGDVIDAIQREHGVNKVQIAKVIACDKAKVSHLGDAERPATEELRTSEIVRLIQNYGSPAVLGPLAAIDGCRVVAIEAAPAADAVVSAGAVTGHAADYLRALLLALRDGRIDATERDQLLAILRELVAEVDASAAGLWVAGRAS